MSTADTWPADGLTTISDPDNLDRVPPMLRTVVYWATLLTPTVFAFIAKLADIWRWNLSAEFNQTGVLVAGTVATVGGFFGVVYRPTAHRSALVAPAAPADVVDDTASLQVKLSRPEVVEATAADFAVAEGLHGLEHEPVPGRSEDQEWSFGAESERSLLE